MRKSPDTRSGSNPGGHAPRLTARERAVLNSLWAGQSTRAMAVRLNVSINTIESDHQSLRRKFGVSSPVELIRAAIRCGVLTV